MMKVLEFFRGKETKNAFWLIGGKIIQMILSLIVGVISARYLGPGNYGLLNYATSYVSFFSSLCTLGINSVIIKDFVDNPDDQGKAIGSTLVLRSVSSFLSAMMIVSIVAIVDRNEPITIAVCFLSSLSLLFQVFDTFNYWFQAQYCSRVTAIAMLIGYTVTSAYKIVLLILQKNVLWFAFASSVDYIVIALLLYIFYKKKKGPKLTFGKNKSKKLLLQSYHYILSGLMVSIYAQTDKFMLKQMLNQTEVGYYATATTICSMWTFVLAAIVDSMYPTILKTYKSGKEKFDVKNRQLYAIVFYISVTVSVCFVLAGELAIEILYGSDFLPAVYPLKIITWYTAFSYLGVARNAWIVCEGKQKYLKYIYLCAAALNVVMNYFLIPHYGASGAAVASLITQMFTSIILPFCIPALRENSKLMLEAITFRKIK